ncbi:MAG: WYL domain-containing protein [Clostridia bacterium]|nr:WYL domain-containing protein [Clostridia bacterium]
MIFNEIYSAYYNAVAKILKLLVNGNATEAQLRSAISESAFRESALTILPAIKGGRWQLVLGDLTTPIRNEPSMPISILERRWLKAISLDKRIRLFGIELSGLEDIEPLFGEEDYYVYDKYSDGDPYLDEDYIERFRIILDAIKRRAPLKIEMQSRKGNPVFRRCVPTRLEYSEKDDKFRVHTTGGSYGSVINLARITKCRPYLGERVFSVAERIPKSASVTLEITDERNAFERVMLHFAHFEKRAECIGERKYRLTVTYDRDDEAEMVIRILSFGPLVRVTEPERFVNLIKEKLKKQLNCGLR